MFVRNKDRFHIVNNIKEKKVILVNLYRKIKKLKKKNYLLIILPHNFILKLKNLYLFDNIFISILL